MSNLLRDNEIKEFKENGAVLIKGKFNISWIEKLKKGIIKAKNNPSPRFVNHTKDKKLPGYYEDFWTWELHEEFKDFVFNSPTPKIAAELLGAGELKTKSLNSLCRSQVQKSS